MKTTIYIITAFIAVFLWLKTIYVLATVTGVYFGGLLLQKIYRLTK